MNIRKINKKDTLIIVLIIAMCGIIFFYQTKKVGFHEDEMYTIASSVNPHNGLMTAYENNAVPENESPTWKTKEYVKQYVTLTSNNYLNMKSIYMNQAYDNHPPFFYVLVHFSTILFLGEFTKYSVFLVNIIAFILSCLVIRSILKLIDKEAGTIGTLILYGLSMGTISMVIYQRMYMTLTFFILLYFYYSIKIYKNDFNLDKKLAVKLGIATVLGFLTQYFFAVYAVVIFVMMIIKMIKDKKQEIIKKYIKIHVIYSAIGVLLFVPSIYHLLFSDRGLSNLSNHSYLTNFITYIKHLAYAFTVRETVIVLFIALIALFIKRTYSQEKSNERFVVLLMTIPSIIYFLVTVKLTSYQELRYIMPVIPFVVLTLCFALDGLIHIKYKNAAIIGISVVLVLNGLVFSKPKFLYEKYSECINIAKDNKDKSFVYIYDNFFNHMQSIPEMMIYEKALIINASKNEVKYLIEDELLNSEDSYILSIKSYMDNEEILEHIKDNTEFKNIKTLYVSSYGRSSEQVENNLYLMSK